MPRRLRTREREAVSRLELIQGTLLSENGVTSVTLSAQSGVDPLRIGRPGIMYTPLDLPAVRNGDVLTFRHAIVLCGICGGMEGACGCQT